MEKSRKRLREELDTVENMRKEVEMLTEGSVDVASVISHINESISVVTHRVKDLRELYLSQTFHLQKLQKKAGDNWRQSYLVHGISRTKAHLHEVQQCIDAFIQVNLALTMLGSKVQGTSLPSEVENLGDMANYVQLTDVAYADTGEHRLMKQRTTEWFDIRKKYPFTGSTMHVALGLDGPKKQRNHIKTHIRGEPKDPVSDELQKMFDHGTKNESNAAATLAARVMPHFYPSLSLCYIVGQDDDALMVVSPDGGLYMQNDAENLSCRLQSREVVATDLPLTTMAVEYKCPYPGTQKLL